MNGCMCPETKIAGWVRHDNWKNADLILFVLFQKWKEIRYKGDKQFCTSFILA
jgi:hypothetical protein